MPMNENAFAQAIRDGIAGTYLLYGEETFLTEQYARQIARRTVDEAFDAFNCQMFDGQTVTLSQLEEACEALPLMAERKCVLVRDMDLSADPERAAALAESLPDTCVLVFWQITVQPDRKKGWQTVIQACEKCGCVACFGRRSAAELTKTLVKGAKNRGCILTAADAAYIVEQTGDDLNLLSNELDKLAALAEDGTVTREIIDRAVVRNLDARVFDLSKAILSRQTARAFSLLHQLFAMREEPLAVLGALSTAYADLYRAKLAVIAGHPATDVASAFKSYKGKEFRLRNAARDASRMSIDTLRDSLDILAETDRALKSGRGDDRVRLEQAVVRLIARAQEA